MRDGSWPTQNKLSHNLGGTEKHHLKLYVYTLYYGSRADYKVAVSSEYSCLTKLHCYTKDIKKTSVS